MWAGTSVFPRTRTSRVPLREGQGQVSAAFPCMSGGWSLGRFALKKRLTIARLVEAVPWVAVRGEDGNLVPTGLQAHSCVDDKTLCTADSQIWVQEDDVLRLLRHRGLSVFAETERNDMPSACAAEHVAAMCSGSFLFRPSGRWAARASEG